MAARQSLAGEPHLGGEEGSAFVTFGRNGFVHPYGIVPMGRTVGPGGTAAAAQTVVTVYVAGSVISEDDPARTLLANLQRVQSNGHRLGFAS